jgi:acyl carrier protein
MDGNLVQVPSWCHAVGGIINVQDASSTGSFGHKASMTLAQRTISMQSTFDTIADIIALTCGVSREQITLESCLLNDLGIDSLELLDVAFAIDDAFSITMPIDQWLQAVHIGRVPAGQYFVLKEFCARVDHLTAAAST